MDESIQPNHPCEKNLLLKRCTTIAQLRYPNDDPAVALEKYVVDNWVPKVPIVKNGIKYMIGPDLEYFDQKLEYFSKRQHHWPQGCIVRSRFGMPLGMVDQTTQEMYSVRNIIAIHPSEMGWSLPRNHKRHLLNFPPEIQDIIFSFAVVVKGGLVQPSMAPYLHTNPGYHLEFTYAHHKSPVQFTEKEIHHTTFKDSEDSYIMLHRFHRPRIDATLLRTCKEINVNGSELLYSGNMFGFDTEYGPYEWRPEDDSRDLTPRWQHQHGAIFKTDFSDEKMVKNWKGLINDGITQVQTKVLVTELEEWVFCMPFLRFLYEIGPENAAMIKKLTFSGVVHGHEDERYCHGCCRWGGLAVSMRICIPFINHFCIQLEELTLRVEKCKYKIRRIDNALQLKKFEEVMRPLLDHEIRSLNTIKSLVVVECNESFTKVDIAADTIEWVKERAARRAREKSELSASV